MQPSAVVKKEILLRQPSFLLELEKCWDESGKPRHQFRLYPAVAGRENLSQGVDLLTGEGHDVSRRDLHYALYLFQRFHLSEAHQRKSATA